MKVLKKLNSVIYTKGKFVKRYRKTLNKDNNFLYSYGIYSTKIIKKNLTENYKEIFSRLIWYMTGYVKTS